MARLSEITSKSQVAPEGHAAVDSIVSSRGSLQGPFTMFLHAPEMAGRVAHLGAYVRFEGELDMRIRVLAALTVARELDAVYVWGAQTGNARKQGVPESTIAAVRERHSRGVSAEDVPRSSTSTRRLLATIEWTMPPSPPSARAWARRSFSSSPEASATTPCSP